MTDEEFLDSSEVQDVGESHIASLLKLESKEAERIIKAYKAIRQDLRDRLESAREGTFTEQRARSVLYQVNSAIKAMSGRLGDDMDSSAQSAAERGIDDLLAELKEFNDHFRGAVMPLNIDALAVATDSKNLLMSRYESSMQTYDAFLRNRISQGLTNAIIEQASLSEVISRISQTFLAEEWKIQQIVRTELHNVYGTAKLNGMRDLWDEGKGDIPDLKKGLYHPMDSRTGADSRYAAKLDLVVPIDEPFKYKWKGEMRVFMTPPDRPNDRSILVPARDSWMK